MSILYKYAVEFSIIFTTANYSLCEFVFKLNQDAYGMIQKNEKYDKISQRKYNIGNLHC